MKSIRILFLTLMIGAMVQAQATTSFALSQDRDNSLWGDYISEVIDITVDAKPGMRLKLDHRFGDIAVIKGSDNTIHIKGEKRVSARDDELGEMFLKEMELKVKERGDRVIIETYYPDKEISRRQRKKIKNFSISYIIEIPQDTNLEINSSFGSIELESLTGAFTVTNGFGKLQAYNLTGETELNNKFGALTVERISGSAQITNEHGALNISDVTGSLTARTSFGQAEVRNIIGDTQVFNGHGAITIEKIDGDVELESSFSRITIHEVTGRATVRNKHGGIYLDTARQGADLSTTFGKVDASNVHGNIRVVNQHGSVDVTNIGGDANIRTTFGSTRLQRIAGSVVVNNQHSSITALNILPSKVTAERHVNLKTTHGTIKLSAPADLSAKLSMTISHGKFKSNFPLTVNVGGLNTGSSSTQDINGTIGDGKDSLDLNASHGNIYLEDSDEKAWDDFQEILNAVSMFDSDN